MQSDKPPRYSFGDVHGVMKDGTSVSVGFDESNKVTIDFTYVDRRDGVTYKVHATGYRTKVDKEALGDARRSSQGSCV